MLWLAPPVHAKSAQRISFSIAAPAFAPVRQFRQSNRQPVLGLVCQMGLAGHPGGIALPSCNSVAANRLHRHLAWAANQNCGALRWASSQYRQPVSLRNPLAWMGPYAAAATDPARLPRSVEFQDRHRAGSLWLPRGFAARLNSRAG